MNRVGWMQIIATEHSTEHSYHDVECWGNPVAIDDMPHWVAKTYPVFYWSEPGADFGAAQFELEVEIFSSMEVKR